MNIKPPVTEFKKDVHCSYCGSKFLEQEKWPRKCFVCYNESYKNPIPVVASLIPVVLNAVSEVTGILIQRRNIEPKKGEWALPGGYINHGENWDVAAARENEEEMGFVSQPSDYHLISVKPSASSSDHMIIFCSYKKVWELPRDCGMDYFTSFVPNEEVQALDIYYGEAEPNYPSHDIAFPTHKECANIFLSQLNPESHWLY